MKIKTKLTLGVGLLFLLVILLAAVSTWYINALKKDTSNILSANYNTLEYSRNMILSLDEMKDDPGANVRFEDNLRKQKGNETEPGEKAATEQLERHFRQLQAGPADPAMPSLIRADISKIMLLNMQAIREKSDLASHTASTATVWIAITGMICFLIAFVLMVNLPGSIADPIKELIQSIREISAGNYHERVHFGSHNEFGELAGSFNAMAEKLEEYVGSRLDEVLMEKKRIDTLINNMRDPVIGLDENEKVLFANDETLRITGLRKEQLVGGQAADLAGRNDLIRILIRDIGREQTPPPQKKAPPLKIFADNKESYFEKEVVRISVIPTGETEKKEIGHVIILKNVTPFKELEFAKTNFIATVSHELKTPISSIQMGLELLRHNQTGALNTTQLQLLDSISDDSNRLLKITGELLNMTQVETGNIQLDIRKNNAHTVLKYALDATKTQAEQRHVRITVDADEPVPDLKMDAEKTAWVLTNFITNAIRYSPEYSEIILSLKKRENALFFSVKDFGKGIGRRYIEKIFDRYFQVPGSPKSGSGLGLSISKDFIEAQGGSIGVESEEGQGSTFFFYFPFRI
ncbi:ATP-binding protein [Compostibacter hankyongensis]|uniref:histidine kinase n=1 Tax=Compostibacter hankyongensis TaxID=1007089 RepID=A0ABP8FMH4_9BACT